MTDMLVLVCLLEVTDIFSRWCHDHGSNNAGSANIRDYLCKPYVRLSEQPLEALIVLESLKAFRLFRRANLFLSLDTKPESERKGCKAGSGHSRQV